VADPSRSGCGRIRLLFGSAVLSRWSIDFADYHALPLADEPDTPDKPFNLTAGVPWELVHVRSAGLDVFSYHLAPPPTDAHHRRSFADRAKSIADEVAAMPPPSSHVSTIKQLSP
jgi:hypothetical protein